MLSELMKNHLKVEISKMRPKDFFKSQRAYEAQLLGLVMQKHGLKEVTACPLCGNQKDNVKELEKYGSPLIRCSNCDLRFHEKIPADLCDIYHDPAHIIYPMDASFEEHYRYRIERFGRERARLLERHCGNLTGKKILDVGCGNGYCLSAFKETGARCYGAELSEKWSKFTSERTGVPVYTDPLENFPERDFDIITIFDVIEHVERPVPMMAAAQRLLKPKGRLLIYTPNFDSFSVKVMGEYSNNIGVGHLILFCYKSLEYLGRETGLKIVHSETRGLDIHSILAYQDFMAEPRDPFLVRWVDELQAMIDHSGCGDYIRVLYEKQ